MLRKAGDITPIERAIILAAAQLRREGFDEFHGFQIAGKIRDMEGARFLAGYGTLYRALIRLQQRGTLQSRWEELAIDENRPRRRYYKLIGEVEIVASPAPDIAAAPRILRILGQGVSRA
ncbi:MAG: PadR family transcriptional regulator [Dehalococcoidales bacterium]|nr:PadR family transcriptional regulator [Dehalococcoidales bacterium]